MIHTFHDIYYISQSSIQSNEINEQLNKTKQNQEEKLEITEKNTQMTRGLYEALIYLGNGFCCVLKWKNSCMMNFCVNFNA